MSETPAEHPHLAVARAFTERLNAKDAEGVAALYADDLVVFRNLDGRELVKKQVMKVVGFLTSSVKELRYTDVKAQPTPTGFVQQHTLRGIAPNGQEVAAHACLVATVRDGLIARVDEYIDSAALAPLMGGKS